MTVYGQYVYIGKSASYIRISNFLLIDISLVLQLPHILLKWRSPNKKLHLKFYAIYFNIVKCYNYILVSKTNGYFRRFRNHAAIVAAFPQKIFRSRLSGCKCIAKKHCRGAGRGWRYNLSGDSYQNVVSTYFYKNFRKKG